MGLPPDLELRDATMDDLSAIADLRERVGWAIHEWALRAVITAQWARCVVVTDGAAVVGVGSGAAYGPLGFVGNMVVDEDQRRRGVGSHVLEAILAFLERGGARRIELYATAEGRPLYERYGFEQIDSGAVAGIPRASVSDARLVAVSTVAPETIPELAEYDAPRFGGDRSGLLALLASDPAHPLIVARVAGAIVGYAWLRPEAGRIGPFVADDPSIAAALLADAFARLPGTDVLSTNLPLSNEPAVAWLESIGIALEPWGTRMGRGAALQRRTPTIYGNTVGALG